MCLTAADLLRLKAATKDLVDLVDGIERAARLTGRSKSQVARWYAARDERDPDQPCTTTIDAAAVAALERDLAERGDGRRPVTEVLAAFGGRGLTEPEAGRRRADVAAAAARLSVQTGALTTSLLEALADGVVTASEAEIGDGKARAVAEALDHLRTALAAARAGGRDG